MVRRGSVPSLSDFTALPQMTEKTPPSPQAGTPPLRRGGARNFQLSSFLNISLCINHRGVDFLEKLLPCEGKVAREASRKGSLPSLGGFEAGFLDNAQTILKQA